MIIITSHILASHGLQGSLQRSCNARGGGYEEGGVSVAALGGYGGQGRAEELVRSEVNAVSRRCRRHMSFQVLSEALQPHRTLQKVDTTDVYYSTHIQVQATYVTCIKLIRSLPIVGSIQRTVHQGLALATNYERFTFNYLISFLNVIEIMTWPFNFYNTHAQK